MKSGLVSAEGSIRQRARVFDGKAEGQDESSVEEGEAWGGVRA